MNGTLLVVEAADSLQVSPISLLMGCRSVKGWYSGDLDQLARHALRSASVPGVRSMNETYPLDRAAEGYDRMMSGKARFRVVLTVGA